MTERIIYAAIGAALLGALSPVLWWLYGLGMSRWGVPSSTTYSELRGWVLVFATCGAVVGFVLKERVGDIVGAVVNGIFEAESGGNQPNWFWLALVAALGMAFIWFFVLH
ncbi:hypothetical protein GN316_15180 [Xylophilus sp. Kf1]|nr:hypothetical protein [Xylophilus sp. Kf1]